MTPKSIIKNIIRHSNHIFPPRKLIIEITENCNLNCPMCPRQFNKISNENMSLEKFKHILDQMPSLRQITILGQGEPFMHPNIFEILKLGKSRNIHFTLVTNGTLLNEENIKRLDGVSVIEASVDSNHQEGYKKIRGADLNLVLNNLKKLKQLKKNIYLRIQAVITKDNIEDLPDFVRLAKSVNANELCFFHLIAFNQENDTRESEDLKKLNEKLQITKKLAEKEGIKFVATPLFEKPRICSEPWFRPRITLNGDVYPCCYIWTTSGTVGHEWYCGVHLDVPQFKYKMGNIFKDDFKRLWNGPDYKLLRETVRKLDDRSLLSPEKINEERKKVDLKERFPYCKVCLFKQNRVC